MSVWKYKPGIPFHFAQAVMNIVRNQGKMSDWDKLREYRDAVTFYAWVESVLLDNSIDGAQADIGWWKAKILGN